MAITSCFSALFARKNSKEKKRSKIAYKCGDLRVIPEEQVRQLVQNSVVGIAFDEPNHADQLAHSSVVVSNLRESMLLLITQGKSPVENAQTKMGDTKNLKFEQTEPGAEAAYEGGDEHEDSLSLRKDFSDFDLQVLEIDKPELNLGSVNKELNIDGSDSSLLKETASEMITYNGHVSDPGIGRTEILCGSLCLKRSCSYIETKIFVGSPTTTHFSDAVLNMCETVGGEATNAIPGSPKSVMTSFSADRAILKKSYSSQVLPSRSAKLWSSLFLLSHNNFHNPRMTASQRISINDTSKIGGGYCSDVLESRSCFEMDNKPKMKLSEITTADDLWSQNRWTAFHSECSTLDRVDAWVQSLGDGSSYPIDSYQNDEPAEEATSYTNILEVEEISGKKQTQTSRPTVKDIMEGSYIFQPSCSFPHMAHISGLSLKAIPVIAAFSSLRSVDLSGNMIAHIPSGSLPKNLLTLDLSKNKITTIEGLKELIRLRVLNLSYNRISRIGHGFPNDTLVKELYLSGNKISYIEGLHRLLKLKVLDLSFNKITSAKALAQLVANDSSLLALNLIGNPVLSNFGEERLRKTICSILPKIAYLNKNPIDPRKGREVTLHTLGSNARFSRKQLTSRVSQSSGRERNTCRRASSSHGERSRMDRSKGRHQQSVTSRK
ncbi:uncharacterized protein LOC121996601 [Zingiber officinale]|uniref:uncharacterized protein LOC121996601 n=1 Tax=Zingiber officinale TaxID=94328 RepID=UPI001C4D84FF|nr:uncharacterized protein LOC121996601 [Zingiber officinale]